MEKSFITSLDELSQNYPDTINGFALEELHWRNFILNKETGSLAINRDNQLVNSWTNSIGKLDGACVLELGPHEGYDSVDMESLGAAEIIAIEGNPRNFIKCLMIKNQFGLSKTKIMLGNFMHYLAQTEKKFDFILASGVLYHLQHPFTALNNIMRLTNRFGICSTYYHPQIQSFEFTGKTRTLTYPGLEDPIVLHERWNTQFTLGKKHGMASTAWMYNLDDLLRYLKYRKYEYKIIKHIENPETKRLRIRLMVNKIV